MPHDPTLALPHPLTATPAFTGPTDTLVYAGAARPRPFLLVARGCSARGVETRAVEAVELGGRLLLETLFLAGTTCGNVLLAPAQARRELLTHAGSLIETLLVSADGLLAQWTRPAALPPEEIQIEFRLGGATWRADGPFLRADAADGVRLLQLIPAPSWSVQEERGQLIVTAVVAGCEGEGIRLLATAEVDTSGAEERLRRLTNARATQAEADLVALRTRLLAIHTDDLEIDDSVAWAQARLDTIAGAEVGLVHELAQGEPFPLDPESRRGWTALGSLASGSRMRPDLSATSPLGMLALARVAVWRGERLRGDMRAVLASDEGWTQTSPALTTAYRAALLTSADAVEPWEGKSSAEDLRARANALAVPVAHGSAGRRLPTLGPPRSAASDPIAAVLAAALELPGRAAWIPPTEDPPPGILRALTAWACLNDGPFERGFALFRQHLGDGFAHGVGLWSERGRFHDPAAAALVPLVLVQGLLGTRIEAYFGRLRLAPRLPQHWSRFAVEGLTIGNATVRMSYELAGGRHRFRFAQESGGVPVMLIFEPILAVPPSAQVWVDGTPADLVLRPAGDRMQASVQLPLAREREVAVGVS